MTRNRILVGCLAVAVVLPTIARADENGISFWLPGQYGSFAATPAVPGWSGTAVYYHTSVDAGAGQEFQRGGQIDAGIDGQADLVLFGPSYAFETPLLGAQLSLGLTAVAGRNQAGADAVLNGPRGNTVSGNVSDSLTSFGDLYPTVALKWNRGVNNFMTYVTGDIPVGDYDPERLANLGIGHGAIDSGGGYTYFNPTSGTEASAVLGFTYNFANPETKAAPEPA